jgi:hypothetical protein
MDRCSAPQATNPHLTTCSGSPRERLTSRWQRRSRATFGRFGFAGDPDADSCPDTSGDLRDANSRNDSQPGMCKLHCTWRRDVHSTTTTRGSPQRPVPRRPAMGDTHGVWPFAISTTRRRSRELGGGLKRASLAPAPRGEERWPRGRPGASSSRGCRADRPAQSRDGAAPPRPRRPRRGPASPRPTRALREGRGGGFLVRGKSPADLRGTAPALRASWRALRPPLRLGWRRRLLGTEPRRAGPRW